jgi:hypothetical protein
MGAAKYIKETCQIDNAHIFGASAGSIVGLLLRSNFNFDDAIDIALDLLYVEDGDVFNDDLDNIWRIDHTRKVWKNDELMWGEMDVNEINMQELEDKRKLRENNEYLIYDAEIQNKNRNLQHRLVLI